MKCKHCGREILGPDTCNHCGAPQELQSRIAIKQPSAQPIEQPIKQPFKQPREYRASIFRENLLHLIFAVYSTICMTAMGLVIYVFRDRPLMAVVGLVVLGLFMGSVNILYDLRKSKFVGNTQ